MDAGLVDSGWRRLRFAWSACLVLDQNSCSTINQVDHCDRDWPCWIAACSPMANSHCCVRW